MAYEIGDPNHIPVHNALVDEVQALADAFSVEVVLPPQRSVGEGGHVDDHNLFTVAIQKIADEGQPPGGLEWATVTAVTGTYTTGTYTDSDGDWTYWRFTGGATNVETVVGTVTVTDGVVDALLVGGGGGPSTGTVRGAGGRTLRGILKVTAATIDCSIGGGSTGGGPLPGKKTTFQNHFSGGGNSYFTDFGAPDSALTDSITGTSVTYAVCNMTDPGNLGYGSPAGATAGNGTIIFRVPTASDLT